MSKKPTKLNVKKTKTRSGGEPPRARVKKVDEFEEWLVNAIKYHSNPELFERWSPQVIFKQALRRYRRFKRRSGR